MHKTECAFCGKELEWNLALFTNGKYSEPVCEACDIELEKEEEQ